mgnify:FL=1
MNRQEALERLKEIQTILVCTGLPRDIDDAVSEAIAALIPTATDHATEPVPCFCGGAPLIHTMPHTVGEPTYYHIECAACHGGGVDYQGSRIEFASEKDAARAWDACMNGEAVKG